MTGHKAAVLTGRGDAEAARHGMTNGIGRLYGGRVIEQAVEQWHRFVAGDASALDDLLADEVVFYSPVVFAPQRGKEITNVYLQGAA